MNSDHYLDWPRGRVILQRLALVGMTLIVLLLVSLFMAADASATGNGRDGNHTCQGSRNCNSSYTYAPAYSQDNSGPRAYGGTGYGGQGGSAESTGIGVGVGLSSSHARGTSKARAEAEGGDAFAVGKGGHANQSQGQTQGLVGIMGQSLENSNDSTALSLQGQRARTGNQAISVEVQGDRVVYPVQKKPDVPAYAPDVNPSPATAPCLVPWGVSGGKAALVSFGASGATKDHGCAFGEVARRAHDIGEHAVAKEALAHMLAIVKKEASVDDNTTDGAVTAPPAPQYADPHTGGYGDLMSDF